MPVQCPDATTATTATTTASKPVSGRSAAHRAAVKPPQPLAQQVVQRGSRVRGRCPRALHASLPGQALTPEAAHTGPG